MLHWSKEHWSIGALEHRSKEHPIRSPHRAWKDVQAPHRAPGTKMIWVFRCNIPSDIESILKSLWCKCVVYICVCCKNFKIVLLLLCSFAPLLLWSSTSYIFWSTILEQKKIKSAPMLQCSLGAWKDVQAPRWKNGIMYLPIWRVLRHRKCF